MEYIWETEYHGNLYSNAPAKMDTFSTIPRFDISGEKPQVNADRQRETT